ncbi:MAG TPA: ATP-binding protein [Methylomirabilota bacterium]|nr:ATP-binding protein [Methylomirabilota bacterium]
MGETRVDLLHLLEDLRDAYPGTPEETLITEIVANSLDSGARAIALTTDPASRSLTIVDDGRGMRRRELARYHDVAASSKVRGDTIGFAGVGIKIALLVSGQVLTETRAGRQHVATTWGLTSRHRAPWKWVAPPGLVGERGTAVRLTLGNGLSPLLDAGYVETVLRRHFEPLLTPGLTEFLAARYPHGLRFVVNGQALAPEPREHGEVAALSVRLGRQRKPAALGWLSRAPGPLGEDRAGLAVSTLGKVIKRGWEWLGLTPGTPDRLAGLIEVPALAQSLTLNKADFMRGGAHAGVYLAYRKAIQEAVSRQLAAWGDATEGSEHSRRRVARPVERDLERVLTDLADDFPLLAALVEGRRGGQAQLPSAGRRVAGEPVLAVGGAPTEDVAGGGPSVSAPAASAADEDGAAAEPPPARPPSVDVPTSAPGSRSGRDSRRPGRYGLAIDFEHRPDDPEPARLVESTVWINDAHPAYRRAAASRSEGYHLALATALALAPLAVEPAKEHAFVTTFLTAWGSAADPRSGRGRRRP